MYIQGRLFKQPCSFPLLLGLLHVNSFLPLSLSSFSLSLFLSSCAIWVVQCHFFSLSWSRHLGLLRRFCFHARCHRHTKKVLLPRPPPPPPSLSLSFFLPHSSTPNFLLLVLSIVLPKLLLLILLSINQSHSHSAPRCRQVDLKGMCSTDAETHWFRCMNNVLLLAMQVHAFYKFSSVTTFLSVNYLDHFLSLCSLPLNITTAFVCVIPTQFSLQPCWYVQ